MIPSSAYSLLVRARSLLLAAANSHSHIRRGEYVQRADECLAKAEVAVRQQFPVPGSCAPEKSP